MSSAILKIESVKKGRALRKVFYNERVKYFGDEERREELQYVAYGNLPSCCADDPEAFFGGADIHERANGSACKEVLLVLPRGLPLEKNVQLAHQWVDQEIPGKPFHIAIHVNGAGPHAHVLYSERVLDEHERTLDQFFRRFNPKDPAIGGAKKTGGGLPPVGLRIHSRKMGERWAEMQERALSDR